MSPAQTPTFRTASPEPDVPFEWSIGDIILNTYEVKEIYSSGGMALVYRVHHRGWGIDLAVKTPRPELLSSADAAESFMREAETWVSLGLHPHLVSCYYVRALGGIPRIFMEYANGGSLEEGVEHGWLYRGSHAEVNKRLLDYAIQFAWGLHFAHEKGLIHQDVKPANVLLTRDGLAKVTDFGIAHARELIQDQERIAKPVQLPENGRKSVRVDTVGLTPLYCSPEQAAAKPLSRRTDIWSWAVSILELYIGKKSWKSGPLADEGLKQYLETGPELSSIPHMPDGLVHLLQDCFHQDPEDRPRDMHAVAEQLQAVYHQVTGVSYPRTEPRIDTILADTLNNRAVSMIDLGREKDALEFFNQALKAQVSHPAAVFNRSLFLWRTGQMTDQEVVASLKESITRHASDWEPSYFLSLVLVERGDTGEAAQVAKATLQSNGNLPPFDSVLEAAERSIPSVGGCVRVLNKEAGLVNSVDISPNGNMVLTGSSDGVVRLWDLAKGTCVRTLPGHEQLVRVVRFTPDGLHAVSASWDETLRYWDLVKGECLAVLQGHTDYVQDMALTPDGRQVVSCSADGTIRIWDLETGRCSSILTGHTDTVWSVAVAPTGTMAVSASFDSTLRLWDLASGRCLGIFDWLRACTSNLEFTPDGGHVLLGAGDNRLWLVDLSTGQPVRSFRGHTGGINAIQVSKTGSWAISGGMDGTVRVWDMGTGRCLRTFSGHRSPVNAVAVCTNRRLVVSGSSDQSARVWLYMPGARAPHITVFPRSSQDVLELSAQVESDLKQVDEYIAQADYSSALELVSRLRIGPEYRQNPRLLEYWDRVGRKGVRQGLVDIWLLNSALTHAAGVNSLTLSRDGKTALLASDDQTAAVWSLHSGKALHTLRGQSGQVHGAIFAPGEQHVLTASADGALRLWELQNEVCIRVLLGHTSDVNGVALSPDGRVAASACNDQTLRIWDVNDGRCLKTMKGHTHFVRVVAFTPDGTRLISASWDKTLRIWDLDRGEALHVLAGHTEVVDVLALTADGRIAASGGTDRSLRLWDLTGGYPLAVFEPVPSGITALAFTPDGRTLFSGEDDGSIRIWSIPEGNLLRVIKAHKERVTALGVTRDGSQLVSTGTDRLLKTWRLDWQYAILKNTPQDDSFNSLLDSFLELHRPYVNGSPARAGKPVWEKADLDQLLEDLSYQGYGGIDTEAVVGALRQRIR